MSEITETSLGSPKPVSRHAVTFVLITVFLDMVGFGLIMPVLPKLIEDGGSCHHRPRRDHRRLDVRGLQPGAVRLCAADGKPRRPFRAQAAACCWRSSVWGWISS
jgi:hypothetical protein